LRWDEKRIFDESKVKWNNEFENEDYEEVNGSARIGRTQYEWVYLYMICLSLAKHFEKVERPASSDCQTVLTNSLVGGDVAYHFFINDKRTYGPRFGKYKLRQELGVSQTAKVRVKIGDKPAFLYDAIRHEPIKYETRSGQAEFEIVLSAARSKVIAVLPEPIKGVEIGSPDTARLGEKIELNLRVLSQSGKPFEAGLPLKVTITDPLGRVTEWSRYTTTRQAAKGLCKFVFTPAADDEPGTWTIEVVDMIAGTTAQANISVSTSDIRELKSE
jgi:hypothetical protein